MKKNLTLTLMWLLFVFSLNTQGQVNSYSYSTTTGEVLETGAFTNLLGTFFDDDSSANTNIGFNFMYNGVNYTNFSVTSNGIMRLGGAAATDYNNLFSNLTGPYLLPYWDDNYTDANGNVQYRLTGAVGSRKLVVEYNLSYLGNTGTADKKFQIWLYETSNIIKFVYGAGNNLNGGFSVGILTNGTTDFISVSVNTNTSSIVTANDNNTTWPGSGRSYTFNPAKPQINVSCFGGSNGSATASPTGGTAPYTYSWSPSGGTGATATGLSAGAYVCTITDAVSQISTSNFTITQPTAISVATGSQTNVSCNGGSNGSASVTPSGGTPGYTYSWSPSGGTAATATGLSAGTYTVTVTDANSCTATRNFTITQPTAISLATGSLTNVSCNGGSNGSATVSPSGGTPSYTYSWSPSGGTAATATGLSAGTYTVTVTDANLCTATRNFTITQPTAISLATGLLTNVSCNGGSNGTASVSPSGGTPGYTYSWSPSGGTAATTTGLSAGTYTVTVTDANSCTATRNFTITQPPAISLATGSLTNVSCNGGSNGTATVSPSGGAGGYTYSWSPSGGTAATASGLSAGAYTVTVTDANACTATRNFTITQPPALNGSTVVTNVACFGGSNGAINLTPSGGTGTYTYIWFDGIVTEDRTGLVAGSYTCIITDANACTRTVNVTVTQPALAVSGTTVVTNIACNGGSNGAINLTPTGGTGPYTFNWGGGITTEDRTGLAAGTYSVTITDANGCTGTVSGITVTQPTAISLATASQTNVSCNGGATGTASVSPSGGAGGYTYSWSPSGGTAATATGLSAGTYTVTVTDANSCTTFVDFIITEPTVLALTAASQTNVSCNGGATGTASVNTPTGGAGGYTYNWTPGNPTGDGTTSVSGLTAGTWTCTVTDANSCTTFVDFIITEPTVLALTAASQTNVSCNGGATGTASVNTPTGGAGGYTYNWTPGNPTGDGTTSVSGLTAGTWTCTVTDANSCTTFVDFTITEPTVLALTAASQTNVSCNGGATGTASVNIPTGGAGGYTYNWTPGNPTGDGTTSVSGLTAGTWTCTVTDANSCTTFVDFIITEPTVLALTAASQTNVSCNGGATGTASVNTPTGGAGGYTYNWTPGNPTGDGTTSVSGLTAGTWTCTVTDANSCTTFVDFIITEPTVLALTAASQTNVSCNGGATGTASVNTPTGGAGGYTYNWTPGNPTGDGTTSVSGLTAGTWTCTVTDANSCTTFVDFIITEPTVLALTAASQTNVSCNGGATGTASVNTPTGGAGGYTYNWTPGNPTGDGTTSVSGLTAGTWTCTVTDANSCTTFVDFIITEPTVLVLTAASQTNVSCNGGATGTASVNTPTGGAGGYTYNWTPGNPTGDGTTSVSGLTAGTWTCTVTDANSCTTFVDFTITEPTVLALTAASQTNVSCNGGATGTASVNTPTGGAGGYTYNWTPGNPTGDGTTSVSGLTAGTWTCTVTDANSCTTFVDFTITEPTVLALTAASQTNVSCNGGATGTASVNTPTGGAGGYTYNWTPGNPTGDGTTSVSGLTAGTWTCTVTDANSCTTFVDFIITEPTVLALTAASQTNVSCNGGATGTASVNIPTGGAGGYTYNWTPGNPTGDGTTSVSGLTAGTWTCTVTDANSCTTFVDFTITEPTAIDNNVTLSSGILQATEAGASYQWYLCPNTIITLDGTNQTYIPTVVGDYKVEITLGGCTITSNCTTVTVLGNEKFDFENFSYYPNPTTGVVTITNSSILSEVSVVNLIGQTVLTKQGNNLEMQLDLSNLPSATYFVKVMSEGKIKTLKILKQ